jgi:ring-1,2-phenylacetyl-CoA epoxidase subunit PaaD
MVAPESVWDVLRTINDPEMPINIVDLGIVERIQVSSVPRPSIQIDLLPTFVGCPALPVIEAEIQKRVGQVAQGAAVEVHFRFHPPWTVDRISATGREALKKFGLTVPAVGQQGQTEAAQPSCPFCGSADVRIDSPFGPTRCRMIYYCETCRNPFEHIKRVGHESTLLNINPKERDAHDASIFRAPPKDLA